MSDDPKVRYDVGYGKPPKDTRFKKGQPSPNPNGRPTRKVSLIAAVQENLGQKVAVTSVDGKSKYMKKVEVIAARMTNDAVSGKIQSQKLIVSLEQKSGRSGHVDREEISESKQTLEERERTRELLFETLPRLLDNFSTAKFSGMFDNTEDGILFPTPVSEPIIEILGELNFSQIRDVVEFKARRDVAVQKMLDALNDRAFQCLRPWNYGLQKSDLE